MKLAVALVFIFVSSIPLVLSIYLVINYAVVKGSYVAWKENLKNQLIFYKENIFQKFKNQSFIARISSNYQNLNLISSPNEEMYGKRVYFSTKLPLNISFRYGEAISVYINETKLDNIMMYEYSDYRRTEDSRDYRTGVRILYNMQKSTFRVIRPEWDYGMYNRYRNESTINFEVSIMEENDPSYSVGWMVDPETIAPGISLALILGLFLFGISCCCFIPGVILSINWFRSKSEYISV